MYKFISPKYTEQEVILKPMVRKVVGTNVELIKGIKIKFKNGLYETKDKSIADMLMKAPQFNTIEGWYLDKEKKSTEDIKSALQAANSNFYCKICKKGFDKKEEFTSHLKSPEHIKNEKLAEKVSKKDGAVK